MSVKLDGVTETVSAMERKMTSLAEQCTKLERLILHFSHEQERYFEPLRHDQLRAGSIAMSRGRFHSEPSLLESGRRRGREEEEEEEEEGGRGALRRQEGREEAGGEEGEERGGRPRRRRGRRMGTVGGVSEEEERRAR